MLVVRAETVEKEYGKAKENGNTRKLIKKMMRKKTEKNADYFRRQHLCANLAFAVNPR